MITCHLSKLETAVDQIKKSYPKLKPADAGLLAAALSLTGRHALAVYEGDHFKWPEEYDRLTSSMVGQLEMIQESIEPVKKSAKAAPEEEPVLVSVGLAPNISAGEWVLQDRNDLKALLGEVIKEGVEFAYAPMDIGWQWALDRVNWSTISGGELSRRIKIKATFTEGAVGMEMGTGKKKPAAKKGTPAAIAAPIEPKPAPVAKAVVEKAPKVSAKVEVKTAFKKAEPAEKPQKAASKAVVAKSPDKGAPKPAPKLAKTAATTAAKPAVKKAPAKAAKPVPKAKPVAKKAAKSAKPAKATAKPARATVVAKPGKKTVKPAKATAKPVKKAAGKPVKKIAAKTAKPAKKVAKATKPVAKKPASKSIAKKAPAKSTKKR